MILYRVERSLKVKRFNSKSTLFESYFCHLFVMTFQIHLIITIHHPFSWPMESVTNKEYFYLEYLQIRDECLVSHKLPLTLKLVK